MKVALLLIVLTLGMSSAFFLKPKRRRNLQDYNVQDSIKYAFLASAAFCPAECLHSWTCKVTQDIKMTDVTYLQADKTKSPAYIGFSPSLNKIVLSFRGISNIENWIEEAAFKQIPYLLCLRCEIHAGFYADYELFGPLISRALLDLIEKYPNTSLLVTGYNLGGALATIAALELKRGFASLPMEVHTFGGPRVGNAALAKHINNKIEDLFRVVHYRDIVPHYPPDLPKIAYHHAAFQVFFNQDMTQYQVCASSGEDRTCSNKFFPEFELKDHAFYFIKVASPDC